MDSKSGTILQIGWYDDESKLELVLVTLEGTVLSWFNGEVIRKPFVHLRDFKERLIAHFSKEKIRDPSQPLCALKQTRSIEEYVHLFEDLSFQVSGLHEKQFEGIFMNGLKPVMREVVNICKLVDLPEMISLALQMKSSPITEWCVEI